MAVRLPDFGRYRVCVVNSRWYAVSSRPLYASCVRGSHNSGPVHAISAATRGNFRAMPGIGFRGRGNEYKLVRTTPENHRS